MGQGELFALTEEQVRRLLECHDDSLLMDLVNDIEENWHGRHHEFLGKEWNLVHCCLSDGTCNPEGGSYPLNRCILGGRHLLPPNDGYMAVLVMPSEVVDIAAALTNLDRDWLCRRYKLVFGEEISDDWLCDLLMRSSRS